MSTLAVAPSEFRLRSRLAKASLEEAQDVARAEHTPRPSDWVPVLDFVLRSHDEFRDSHNRMVASLDRGWPGIILAKVLAQTRIILDLEVQLIATLRPVAGERLAMIDRMAMDNARISRHIDALENSLCHVEFDAVKLQAILDGPDRSEDVLSLIPRLQAGGAIEEPRP